MFKHERLMKRNNCWIFANAADENPPGASPEGEDDPEAEPLRNAQNQQVDVRERKCGTLLSIPAGATDRWARAGGAARKTAAKRGDMKRDEMCDVKRCSRRWERERVDRKMQRGGGLKVRCVIFVVIYDNNGGKSLIHCL